ncbi:ChrR family anti-sigma-E factor [Paraferrimonas sedimenticola]|uniref:Transcriptional regulator n=1 Tax=Paraferrimonas sedimenticola TaxID=375674 RepID=A0AA37RYX4_9GAMM|nr:ChrR family anti-sigma-E factor [Paraferrimonas sedimenticola]GLP98055.1 transcriptional regulator [Paraferrimonas sedimenticola]
MVKAAHHPDDSLLLAYSTGDLGPAHSIMISAHVELCPVCQARVAHIEAQQAAELVETKVEAAESLPDGLADMMSSIMEMPVEEAVPQAYSPQFLMLNGKQYRLPRVLADHTDKIGPWSRLPGKLQRASVTTGGTEKINFIYMDEDSRLPEHTHTGTEITLVLDGEFVDETGVYGPGDFIIQDGQHTHTPATKAGQDCLCLTMLQSPLHFTSGFASLLNPFSQLFFR